MRYLPVVPALLLLALVAGCGGGEPVTDAGRAPSASPSAGSSPDAPSASSPSASPTYTDPSGSPACAEVRDGIDAFNAGDLVGTVDHFEEAVPLAKDQLDGSQEADDLLEAVEWYAALPPEDYPGASRSSAEFAKYQVITLGQCGPVSEPSGSPSDPGEQI